MWASDSRTMRRWRHLHCLSLPYGWLIATEENAEGVSDSSEKTIHSHLLRNEKGGASIVKEKMKKEEVKNETVEDIIRWIRKLKFKKKLIGGVDEADVLKKIEELNMLYEKALLNERARYDALLREARGGDAGNET